MNATEENLTEKALEKVSAEKPVSVYSVNFARVINNFAEKKNIDRRKDESVENVAQNSLSQKVFKWRNAIAVAAILAIGVFHFAFQMSFIRTEISEYRPVVNVPPVKIEPPRAAPIESKPAEFKAEKIDSVMPEKNLPAVKRRQSEIAPVKPQPKKKEAVETRAERLRRAERILTGV